MDIMMSQANAWISASVRLPRAVRAPSEEGALTKLVHGNPEYFGNSVTTSGYVDSVWFNFPEILIVDMDYAVQAVPESGDAPVTLSAGAIPLGKYQYAFNIDKMVTRSSNFRIVLTAYGKYPWPLSAYLRVKY